MCFHHHRTTNTLKIQGLVMNLNWNVEIDITNVGEGYDENEFKCWNRFYHCVWRIWYMFSFESYAMFIGFTLGHIYSLKIKEGYDEFCDKIEFKCWNRYCQRGWRI